MTKSTSGSSLSQTPSAHRNHLQVHNNRIPDPEAPALELRQEPVDGLVDSIVTQVVSVVQVVDSAGAQIGVQTLSPGDVAVKLPEVTIDNLLNPTALPDIVLPESPPLPQISLLPDPTIDLGLDSLLPGLVPTQTSTPSTAAPFPTLSAPFNSTNSSPNGTFSNNTAIRPFAVSSSSISGFFNSSRSTASADSPTTTVTLIPNNGAGLGDSAAGGNNALPSPTVILNDGPGTKLPAPAATIAGGVIGAAAGAAILVFLVMVVLKWKRRQASLTGDGRSRGLLTDGDAGGSGTGPSMMHRALPFTMPAAIAGMSGYKRFSQKTESTEDGEKGFYRVAGRKLPSVLQVGGDGYTDPRQSVMSGSSSHYRDSMAFFDANQTAPPRLALGSPMRPVSGIPIMRSGPARTPVTEQGHFFSGSPVSPTLPRPDPLGRSLTSHDGSHGSQVSASRFTERI